MGKNIIYRCISPSGKCYIGKTSKTLKHRINGHINMAERGSEYTFHKAIRKYGIKNFDIQVVEENIPNELINKYEIKYIMEFDSFNNGYNMTKGGEGVIGFFHSEKTKSQMSKRKKGVKRKERSKEHCENISKSHTGKKHTENTKNKISKKKKGKVIKFKNPEERNSKISKAQTGRVYTDEVKKKKMSEIAKGRERVETQCPHCGKRGKNNMFRFHFNNCKTIKS